MKPLPMGANFRPPRLLRNAHVQSVLASSGLRRMLLLRRHGALHARSSEHIIDCGNGVRLQGFHSSQDAVPRARGLVVVLHGWEGSAQSNYVLNTSARLLAEGFDVFRLNFRDHGQTHHLNREIFHSGRLDEVVAAVRAVAVLFPAPWLAITGFSLGGNFALRVALQAPAAGLALDYALAVCPVVNPHTGMHGIENAPWFYEYYFLLKWRDSLRRKQRAFPDTPLFSAQELRGNLRELTRSLVLRHTDFGSLENYLDAYSIAGGTLANLQVPASILTSSDDPIIPIASFRELQLPPQVELDISGYGGHCGFIRDWSLHSWTEDYIAARMLRMAGV